MAPRERRGLDYAAAGVDIEAEADTVAALVRSVAGGREGNIQPLSLPGQFAGGVRFGDTALILCTDGVGSKVEVARALGRFDTVGIDCIAMNVNDAVCLGAEPVAFVDYLAVEQHDRAFAEAVGRGLAEGARQANVAIVGGETATLPGIVKGFDIAGTCLAVAPVDELVTGAEVAPTDVILGLPSSGIHSNGLTLARKAVERAGLTFDDTVDELDGETLGEALLTPTRIYVREVLELLDAVDVHGLVHITGGGLTNLPRVNPTVGYELTAWPSVPAVFRAIQRMGEVDDAEMFRTFNMGVGMAAVVAAEHAQAALEAWAPHGGTRLGEVVRDEGVELVGADLRFPATPQG